MPSMERRKNGERPPETCALNDRSCDTAVGKTASMRLYSYVVARDFGFAPNPFFGVCTLATCKPDIRKGLMSMIGLSAPAARGVAAETASYLACGSLSI